MLLWHGIDSCIEFLAGNGSLMNIDIGHFIAITETLPSPQGVFKESVMSTHVVIYRVNHILYRERFRLDRGAKA